MSNHKEAERAIAEAAKEFSSWPKEKQDALMKEVARKAPYFDRHTGCIVIDNDDPDNEPDTQQEDEQHLQALRLQMEAINRQKVEKQAEIDEALKRVYVVCDNNGCKKKSRIGGLTYVQTHWYVEPYSCSEGDYWKQSQGMFVCPHCERVNRLHDRKEVSDLKYSFKNILDVYDRRW